MKIYRKTDKISIDIDDVTIKVSPLTYEHKVIVQDQMLQAATGDVKAGLEGAKLAIKYSLKELSGAELADGTPYELELENGVLSDDCVEDLTNSGMNTKLTLVCISLLTGIRDEFTDPQTGKKLAGVAFTKNSKRAQKKK